MFGSSSTIRTVATQCRRRVLPRRWHRQRGCVAHFGEKLGREALAFRDPLDLDCNCVD
jgi:hypothetical protein